MNNFYSAIKGPTKNGKAEIRKIPVRKVDDVGVAIAVSSIFKAGHPLSA